MPHTCRDEAPIVLNEAEIEGRYVELGDYTVAFETHRVDMDPAPLFAGLPDDRCQCTHFGVVEAGQLIVRYADREEKFTAGDAYVMTPGHLPLVFAGCKIIEFTATKELQPTMAVLGANMAKAAAQ